MPTLPASERNAAMPHASAQQAVLQQLNNGSALQQHIKLLPSYVCTGCMHRREYFKINTLMQLLRTH